MPHRSKLEQEERIEAIDLIGGGVDIQLEFGDAADGQTSIHEYLKADLDRVEFDVVLYDHRSGEIADLFTFAESVCDIIVRPYHWA